MSDEESRPAPEAESDVLKALRRLELTALEMIAKAEVESAPSLSPEEVKEQAATYEGTSDHASFVEQLADKEVARDYYKKENDKLKFDVLQQKFNERFDLHELRRKYIPYLFWMVVGWLVLVGAMVVLSALGWSKLTDPALIALITTTTATVVGMFVIAARWLFPSPPDNNKKPKK